MEEFLQHITRDGNFPKIRHRCQIQRHTGLKNRKKGYLSNNECEGEQSEKRVSETMGNKSAIGASLGTICSSYTHIHGVIIFDSRYHTLNKFQKYE